MGDASATGYDAIGAGGLGQGLESITGHVSAITGSVDAVGAARQARLVQDHATDTLACWTHPEDFAAVAAAHNLPYNAATDTLTLPSGSTLTGDVKDDNMTLQPPAADQASPCGPTMHTLC